MTNTQISNFEGSSLSHISLHNCLFISAGDKTPTMAHLHDGNINIPENSRIFSVSSYQEQLLMFLDFGRYGHTSELNWGFCFSPPKKSPNHFFQFYIEIWATFTEISFWETTIRGMEISPLYPVTPFSWQLKWHEADWKQEKTKSLMCPCKYEKFHRQKRWGIYICPRLRRRRQGSGASRGSKVIHSKIRRVNAW